MENWTPKRRWSTTPPPWTAATTCRESYAAPAACSSTPGGKVRDTSGWPSTPMITTAFTPAIRSLSRLSPARSAFHGITAFTGTSFCLGSIRRLAVGQERELQFEDVALLAEAKTDELHCADVARFPIGSFERLVRFVGWRPFHAVAGGLHRLRIDFVNLLLLGIDEQVALPQVHQQQSFFLRVIDVPGFRRFVIELYDRKCDWFPKRLITRVQNGIESNGQQKKHDSGNEAIEPHCLEAVRTHRTAMMNEITHAGQRNFPWPGMLANTPARPRYKPARENCRRHGSKYGKPATAS